MSAGVKYEIWSKPPEGRLEIVLYTYSAAYAKRRVEEYRAREPDRKFFVVRAITTETTVRVEEDF